MIGPVDPYPSRSYTIRCVEFILVWGQMGEKKGLPDFGELVFCTFHVWNKSSYLKNGDEARSLCWWWPGIGQNLESLAVKLYCSYILKSTFSHLLSVMMVMGVPK